MHTPKGEYSFSTCWNIKRHTEGRAMAEEIRSLGFRQVELNYNVTKEMLTTIEPMIERGEIGVSSVHNTFPHTPDPDYGTDSVLLGFDDEEKRVRAIELLLQSAEYAHRYGAKAVVVHPGEVPFPCNIDQQLKGIYNEQGPDSPAYTQLWREMLDRRESLSGQYLRRIGDSLEEVCERSAAKGYDVAFGIETRSRCYQMPTLQEAKTVINRLKGAPVYLWYDIGHGMMMDRMGLYDNAKEAGEMIDDIIGVHIHETIGLSDHWCPYVNSKDMSFFDRFLAIIDRARVKVYELKSACTPEEIEESHALITGKISALKNKSGEGQGQ
ncbi:sugar phosphate isomerase/epimerase [Paenibacillus sp. sptzw28]|uniref:sugar phosphate isomerase/epimerase family protein n=1 Tax=Paenibacillus sp. sptzw28 TaxID=715179 RepID=UPI001C6E4DFD|nr:TIM barrel protein [Paenibacillus sp. sptzw28]QYR20325.1 sugar phosphate isomerase/epimerase [Paenibacillus sp. sptzw28]